MIKVSYDENLRVTGIGNENIYETTEPFILLDLTDEQFEQLLETPFNRLMVDVEYNSVFSSLTLEEPMDEISDIERLTQENEELKERLAKIESLLNILRRDIEMEITIQMIINEYKDELARLMNENILLRAQVKQLQNELNTDKGSDE